MLFCQRHHQHGDELIIVIVNIVLHGAVGDSYCLTRPNDLLELVRILYVMPTGVGISGVLRLELSLPTGCWCIPLFLLYMPSNEVF